MAFGYRCHYYITFNFQSFVSHKSISPIFITLPNDIQVYPIIFKCLLPFMVLLFYSLILDDVLYVRELHVNIISTHKLVHTLHCKLSFDFDSCVIVQNTSRRMIGSAKLAPGTVCDKSATSSPHCVSLAS